MKTFKGRGLIILLALSILIGGCAADHATKIAEGLTDQVALQIKKEVVQKRTDIEGEAKAMYQRLLPSVCGANPDPECQKTTRIHVRGWYDTAGVCVFMSLDEPSDEDFLKCFYKSVIRR